MAEIAKQSTAADFIIGPVVDASGAFVSGGVVGDFKISKNGAAPAALNGSATATHRHTGFYSLSLTASDVDTVGRATVTIDDTVNSCAPLRIQVIEEAVYDAFFAASAVGIPSIPANWITAAGINADAFTAAKFAADVTTELQSGLATAAELAKVPKSDGTASWNATALEAIEQQVDDALLAAGFATVGDIADGVWDEARAGHVAAGSFGEYTNAKLADGVTHGGSTAMIRLGSSSLTPAFYVTNSGSGSAVTYENAGTEPGFVVFSVGTDAVVFNGSTGGSGGGSGVRFASFDVAGGGRSIAALSGTVTDITGNLSGSVGSVTGAVGSVTGNVGGNVTGSIGSIAANGITSGSITDGAITDAKITLPAESAGRPTTALGMLRRIFEWFGNKRIRTRATGVVQLRNAADSGNLETATQSTAGGAGAEIDTQTAGS